VKNIEKTRGCLFQDNPGDVFFNIAVVIKSRKMRSSGQVSYTFKSLVGKSEGKRPFARHRRKWDDNIRTDLR
jgi:hypothetical protein